MSRVGEETGLEVPIVRKAKTESAKLRLPPAVGIILGASLVASYIPAYRASRIDPMEWHCLVTVLARTNPWRAVAVDRPFLPRCREMK